MAESTYTTQRETRPHHRLPHLGGSSQNSSAEAQARRRAAALESQRSRRTHAFELARRAYDANKSAAGELAGDVMDGLSLGAAQGQYNDASSEDEDGAGDALQAGPSVQGDIQMQNAVAGPSSKPKSSKPRHQPRKKTRYQPWARNLLSFAETLDLSRGLPEGFAQDWRIVVAPRGKRCLCASISAGNGADASNTVLYSRVSGRPLARLSTVLPPDCLLDCVYDSTLGVLWVLDLIKWSSSGFLVECEAEFRAFFLTSRLSELPPQLYNPPSTPSSQVSALLIPVPSLSSPLSPATLSPFLTAILNAHQQSTPIFVPSPPIMLSIPGEVTRVELPLVPEGVLCYLLQAGYESGETSLVGWVPLEEEGNIGGGAVARMHELVLEWERGVMEG